ncbi:MAG: protein kinase [Defluviitaleaceae bacterium]|nr:protein kinase [Defluviitaleaceae bacterium]
MFDINDIEISLESFKLGITSRATGGDYKNDEYQQMRRFLLTKIELNHLIPKFLKICHSTDEFWQFIKAEFDNYADRRAFLANEINPIIDYYAGIRISKDTVRLNSDSYELGEEIGYGGFGRVYKYHHKLLNMLFAIKIFDPRFVPDEEKQEGEKRFFREAKMLFSLKHENIANVYDIGHIDGKPFIRLEFIEGQTLSDCIATMGGGVSFERSKKPIKGILTGLNYAHERGIIHRDLKPSNVMVLKDGTIKIIDFGVSAYLETSNHTKLTKTGEQIAGGRYTDPCLATNPSLRDIRSDIYSIGALWFFILTNRDPSSDAKNVLMNTKDVTPAQVDVVLRCLHSDINKRFTNCKELLDLLFNEEEPIKEGNSKRLSNNNITQVTRKSIIKYFVEQMYRIKGVETPPSFQFNGDLSIFDFLKRLYELDTLPSNEYANFEDELVDIIERNNQLDKESEHAWNNFRLREHYNETYLHMGWHWLFSEERFALSKREDDYLLSFLCEIFHPEVRDWLEPSVHSLCETIIDKLNTFLREDGYELYEDSQISGRPVYSYRYCI